MALKPRDHVAQLVLAAHRHADAVAAGTHVVQRRDQRRQRLQDETMHRPRREPEDEGRQSDRDGLQPPQLCEQRRRPRRDRRRQRLGLVAQAPTPLRTPASLPPHGWRRRQQPEPRMRGGLPEGALRSCRAGRAARAVQRVGCAIPASGRERREARFHVVLLGGDGGAPARVGLGDVGCELGGEVGASLQQVRRGFGVARSSLTRCKPMRLVMSTTTGRSTSNPSAPKSRLRMVPVSRILTGRIS
jgi:hypothetical protein